MLKLAAGAIYTTRDVQGISPARLRRFFLLGRGPRAGSFRVVPEIRDLVKFRHLDLRNPVWTVPNDFPIIFCRNVSIYFAEEERLTLLDRLAQHLRPGGWLAMGNGEILPEVPPTLAKALAVVVPKRGVRTDGACAIVKSRRSHRRSPEPLEVLVVDDSALVRQKLKSIIETDSRFRVVLAADPYEAVAMLSKSVPGVIVLDVEMPRMDGLTFLRKLMRQHPLPVVLCTAQAERAVTALEMGAIEVIAKPDWNDASRLPEWSQSLLESIRNAARAGRLPFREDRPAASTDPRHSADVILPKAGLLPRAGSSERIIVVGVSTGGVQALQQLLAGFPASTPGIVMVQHMPADFTSAFANRLDNDPRIEMEVGRCAAARADPRRAGTGRSRATSTAWFAARAPAIESSWSRARRSAGTVRASRSCFARQRRRPGRTRPA